MSPEALLSVRAIVFDLDGTLLDTLVDLANAANDCLIAEGLPPHDVEAYRIFVGDGVPMLMRRIVPAEHHAVDLLERCVARFNETYERRWREQSRPYPGIEPLLEELRVRNVPVAVLSNKPQEFTRKCTDFFFGSYPFRVVFGARPGVPRKPSPEAAWEICQMLQVAPGEAAYVGDSSVDMQTAAAAGMPAVGVSWGFRERAELLAHGAAIVLDEPRQLIELLPLRDR